MERLLALIAVAGAAWGVAIVAEAAGLSSRPAAGVGLAFLVVGVVVVMATPGWSRSVNRSRERAGR